MIRFRSTFGTLRKLAWQPGGRNLAVLALDGHSYQASLWSADGELLQTAYLGRARGPVPAAGGNIVAVADDSRIRLRGLSGEDLYEVHLSENTTISALALSANAAWLASVRPWPDYEFQSTIHVHELHALGAVQHGIFFAGGRVLEAAFDPSAQFLMTLSDVGITIWDVAKKESIAVQPEFGLRNAAWSSDSKSIFLRKVQRLECRSAFDGRVRWEQRLAGAASAMEQSISPDGSTLAATDSETARLFSASDGRELAAYNWGIGPIMSLAYDPDGLTIAAAAADGHVVIWDAE